jgi:agmatinase
VTIRIHDKPGAFGGLPAECAIDAARFAVMPIPYDGTSTWLKGADRGPQAILDASANMELYDIQTDSEPWLAGIVTLAPIAGHDSPEAMAAAVRTTTADLIEAGKTVVGLGGEHSVSIGLIQAHAARYPGLTVLQFDAHGDTRDSYEGSEYNHACVMARAAEVCAYVQVGIRSLDMAEKHKLVPGRTFFAHQYTASAEQMQQIIALLDGPVYITIDLDVLDPAEMPSTGTPEPGGMAYRDLVRSLDAVCAACNVVGFDVVELLPNAQNKAPDFLAARLVYQLMAFLTRN